MTDPKNTQSPKSASPSGQQDIVKPGQPTAPSGDTTPSTSQDIVKPK
jgi:hypothetical protein